ncbi:MAG: DUF4197 domain-containing protein [Crocinitomicaceae bacterium]|nr:DUF4197 domain-containing protein [Crocinitomicaceae bacterium]
MKKKLFLPILLGLFSMFMFTQCDILHGVANEVVTTGTGGGGEVADALTNEEVVQGLKEALTVGIKNGAALASKEDGFFGNPKIFIPWPDEAIKVKEWGMNNGFSETVENVVLSFNRAAEEASKKATPIFVDAITNMSIGDGFEILNGSDSAATMYLIKNTSEPLKAEFKPVVHDAIEKVEVTKFWTPITTAYNKVAKFSPNMNEVNTDLDEYVTQKGMDGLFFLIKQEEKKIRLDPVARVTDILKKVFGSLTGGN